MPEWATSIVDAIMGPGGAIVTLCLVIYFLWKLYREEQSENRANFHTVGLQSKAIEALTAELRAWRDAITRDAASGR